MTALDATVLERLGTDVQDRGFAASFAGRYRKMLGTRVARIVAALRSGDTEAAMDAVLSLKVSSATVGAHELADLALEIEQDLRGHDLRSALLRAGRLPLGADRTGRALAAHAATYAA